MDSKNVAIVWAPNLLKPRELELSAGLETLQVIGLQAVITEQLIKHHKFLFDDNDHYVVDETVKGSKQEQSRDMIPDIDENVDKLQIDQSSTMKTPLNDPSAMQQLQPPPSVS